MPAPRRNLLARHGDYRRLWTAATISLFGTQVSLIAIPVIAVFLLKASPFQVALLGTVEFLPFVLLTLPAGVWVDRLPRRLILVNGDVGRAVSLLSIPIAYSLGVLTIWQLFVVGFVNGCFTVFFDVADQSYLPEILEADDLIEGNSKLQVSGSAAQVLGQPLGGGLVALLTAPYAVMVDALSFLASGGLIYSIRKRPRVRAQAAAGEADGPRPGMRSEIAAGLRYVLGHQYLRYIAASTGTSNFFSNMAFAIFPVFAYITLGLSPFQVGLIGGLGSLGFLAGALVGGRLGARFGVGRTIIGSMFIFGPSMVLMAIAQPGNAFVLLVASMFLGGFAGVVYNINQVSLRQAITPENMQGRMNATMRFIVWGTIPIGSVVGGLLASTPLGVRGTIGLAAVGSFFAFVPLLFGPLKSLERIPTPVAEPGEAATSAGATEKSDPLLQADSDMSSPGSSNR